MSRDGKYLLAGGKCRFVFWKKFEHFFKEIVTVVTHFWQIYLANSFSLILEIRLIHGWSHWLYNCSPFGQVVSENFRVLIDWHDIPCCFYQQFSRCIFLYNLESERLVKGVELPEVSRGSRSIYFLWAETHETNLLVWYKTSDLPHVHHISWNVSFCVFF